MLGNSVQSGWGRSPVREGGEVRPVPVDITQQLLDLPDAPEVRCGWAHD